MSLIERPALPRVRASSRTRTANGRSLWTVITSGESLEARLYVPSAGASSVTRPRSRSTRSRKSRAAARKPPASARQATELARAAAASVARSAVSASPTTAPARSLRAAMPLTDRGQAGRVELHGVDGVAERARADGRGGGQALDRPGPQPRQARGVGHHRAGPVGPGVDLARRGDQHGLLRAAGCLEPEDGEFGEVLLLGEAGPPGTASADPAMSLRAGRRPGRPGSRRPSRAGCAPPHDRRQADRPSPRRTAVGPEHHPVVPPAWSAASVSAR